MSAAARLVDASDESLAQCGERLRHGDLVAFPTETVYGLGCHALDPTAVPKIFQAKERPLTDPLIVHVLKAEDALKLWKMSTERERKALSALCDKFWPGPLTLVAKAAGAVPGVVMAGTGFVACRSPRHPVARALLKQSGVPIAAPSANKFGHVSPTRPQHVMEDLGKEDVWVIDMPANEEQDLICDVGVESTVAKLTGGEGRLLSLEVLRQGAVSVDDLQIFLNEANISCQVTAKKQATQDTVAHVAPGQTIKHYSPHVPSYMISQSRWNGFKDGNINILTEEEQRLLETAVVIDFNGQLKQWKDHALAYRDLSVSGNSKEAAGTVFETLRWSETIEGAERVYFPEFSTGGSDGLTLAVKDRLTRAASGHIIEELR